MKFSIGAVLSITTGKLLSSMDDVYKILDFMTGDSNFTNQLGRAAEECRPWLSRRHPELDGIDVSDITADNYKQRLAVLAEKYGESFDIKPIPRDEHTHIDPVEELETMVGKKKVIVVKV